MRVGHPTSHKRCESRLQILLVDCGSDSKIGSRERLYQQEIYRLRQEVQRLRNDTGRRAAEEVNGVVRWPSAETLRAARNLARKVIDAERRRS